MIKYIIYLIISLLATTIGALTGMGGGVIIKPVLDVMNDFNVEVIGILSSITVFSMAIVSVGKQLYQKTKVNFLIAIPLALGSVIGGYIGQKALNFITLTLQINEVIVVIQNVLLSILIVGVYIYMRNKSKIKTLKLSGILPSVAVGVFLGIISSFLGIGGGPINVALLIYLFSFDTKTATVNSIITILFAQMSKLSTVAISTGFSEFYMSTEVFSTGYREANLSMLMVMVPGAILGGFIGSGLNKKLTEKRVEKCFNAVQLIVLAISISNIIINI